MANNEKLPKWEPKARRGVCLGSSPAHTSNVPLVLTLKTGYVTLEYHVVFDDCFSTVEAMAVVMELRNYGRNCLLIRILPSII